MIVSFIHEGAELSCDLRSFGAFRSASQSVLHHDDVKAVNTESHPNNVVPMTASVIQGSNMIVLPAASWNVIRFVR
ncbi:MAG: hypothetical protein IKH30_14970 [Clostridia bacterium]|nr:hypothetical protein [Clostridia bacterium]